MILFFMDIKNLDIIIISWIVIMLVSMFMIVRFLVNQSNHIGRIEERTLNIGKSLSNLGQDFKEHIKDH